MKARGFDLAVLALGVLAVSTAAPLIREAAAPALVIAAYRLSIASLPLLFASATRGRRLLPGRASEALLCLLAGLCLALHFAFWIASVQQTSIITSVVLVTAQPLLVALASGPLLGEPPNAGVWAGIVLALAGALLMVGSDIGSGSETLTGDLYAVLGAVFASGYFLIGRRLRTGGQDWLSYVTPTYTIAALALTVMALGSGHSASGYSTRTYAFMLALALVPQLVGHTALNRSLGYLPAVSVTIAVLGEPVGATILGVIFLGEEPGALELLGGLLVLGGVWLGLRGSGHVDPALADAQTRRGRPVRRAYWPLSRR